jgi:serine protease inhibitor
MSNHACRVIPLVLAMTLAAGCKETTGVLSPGPGGPGPAQLTEQEAAVSQANTGFGLSLLREVLSEESDPNVLISPLSASMALGMTMNGAGGDTWDAMRSTLGFGTMPEAEVREAYRGLIDYLNGRDPSVEFGLANSAWYEESFPVHEAFLDVAREYFDAEVVGLDFQDPASPGVISAWAEEKTGGRIRDLVTEIDPLEKLFLVNAVYFSAPWSLPFNPDATRDGDFRTLEGDVVQVPLMSLDGNVHYRSDDLVEAVELIYADSAYSMVGGSDLSNDLVCFPGHGPCGEPVCLEGIWEYLHADHESDDRRVRAAVGGDRGWLSSAGGVLRPGGNHLQPPGDHPVGR